MVVVVKENSEKKESSHIINQVYLRQIQMNTLHYIVLQVARKEFFW